MAKQQLTMVAIRFLVETYDDESTNYTFGDIAKMIVDKFGITVTTEAVRKSYHRHKEELRKEKNNITESTLESAIKQRKSEQLAVGKTVKKNLTKETKKDFDMSIADDLSKGDLDNLFKG